MRKRVSVVYSILRIRLSFDKLTEYGGLRAFRGSERAWPICCSLHSEDSLIEWRCYFRGRKAPYGAGEHDDSGGKRVDWPAAAGCSRDCHNGYPGPYPGRKWQW